MYKFEKLLVWQKAMDLVEKLYQIQAELPEDEKYGLGLQLRRAAVSIPMNVAEGSANHSDQEFKRFLKMSRGSLYEVVTILKIIDRLYKINVTGMLNYCQAVGKLLSGLINFLKTNDQ